MEYEHLFRNKGSVKLAIWNTVNLVENKLSVLVMPLQKLLASKFVGEVVKRSAKLTEDVIKQYLLQSQLRSRQSKNIIAEILDKEFKTCSLLLSLVAGRSLSLLTDLLKKKQTKRQLT